MTQLENSWWIQSAVKMFPSCVHRSSCIILMVTAVCFQEWQSSLWGLGGGGGGSAQLQHSDLHRAVRDHWHNVCARWRGPTARPVKGDYNHDFRVISVPSPWQFDRYSWALHPGVTGEVAWSAFKGIWVTFFWLCCRTLLLWIRKKGKCEFTAPF